MDFAILGPIAVYRDGEGVNLGGPKQRAVLAMLLLQANEVVSRDRLIEGLWGERAPATASRSIDSYVSRLRGVLGSDRIERVAPGYRIRIEPGELDLNRFEMLLEDGRRIAREGNPRSASDTLHAATELWRGVPLADLVYEPFAASEVARLEERRLLAVEERVQADLALGGGAELVAELERLLLENPFRERLVAALMLALYRAGRQKDALEAYEIGRRRLVTELGLEPGPELQGMQRRILEHDPSLVAEPIDPTGEERKTTRPVTRARAFGAAAIAAVAVSATIGIVLGTSRSTASSTASSVDKVVALERESSRPTQDVSLDGAPGGVAALDGALWITDPTADRVSELDLDEGVVVDRIPVPSGAGTIAAGARTLWVAGAVGKTVSRIDSATGEVTQTLDLERGRVGALAFGAGRLWIADVTEDAVIEVDPATGDVVREIPVELRPTVIAADAGSIWVGDYRAGTVAEVDRRSGRTLALIHVGNGPAGIALERDAVWVANSLDSTVSRVNPTTGSVVATIPVESGPSAIAVDDESVWVANEFSGTVTRIDGASNTIEHTASVEGAPTSLAVVDGEVWAGVRSVAEHRGGTLVLQHSRPISIDPALHLDLLPPVSDDLTRDGLVTYNHVAGPAGTNLVPSLALSIPRPTNGGRTYTFRLRPGIRYSDGRLVRAADFRRALERVFALGSSGKDYFTGIVGAGRCASGSRSCDLTRGVVTNERERTVTFHLREPDPSFLANLTTGGLATPVPGDTPLQPARNEPIPGTGPYMIASVDEQQIRYVRNPYFREWSRAAKPDGNPDEIVMRFEPRPEELVRSVEEGRADWLTESVPASRRKNLARRFPGRLHANEAPLVQFFQINTTLPPFDDVRARRALNFAFDRAAVVRALGGQSAAAPTCQVLPPGIRGYRRYCPYTRAPRPDGRWSAPDLARARRLVATSGTEGERIVVWGITDDPSLGPRVSRLVASTLRRLGYRTSLCLVPSSFSPIPRGCDPSKIQLGPAGWLDLTAYGFFGPWMSCGGASNPGYCDPVLDARMERARALEATDPRAAARLWEQVDHEIADRALWLPMVNARILDFVSARVRNYQYHPYWGFLAGQAWLE